MTTTPAQPMGINQPIEETASRRLMKWLFGGKSEAMGNLLLHLAGFTRITKDNELRLNEAEFDVFMGEVYRRAKAAHDLHHATTGRAKTTLKSALRLEIWAVAAAIVVIIFGSYGPLVRLLQRMPTEIGREAAQATVSSPVQTGTVVVAAQPLAFGTVLSRENVTEIPWPAGSVPEGAFAIRDQLFKEGRRVALTPMQQNELILKTRITGPGQRATLSELLDEGKRAATVRVDDVRGVAGFVLPGDRVDVILIRAVPGSSDQVSDVLLHVKVLAVDQLANERQENPTLAKAVTLEVDTDQAQRILLATNVGKLSLILRQAGESNPELAKRVTERDLGRAEAVAAPVAAPARRSESATVSIIRNMKREEYSVMK